MGWKAKWRMTGWLIVALAVLVPLTVEASGRAALVIGNSRYAERPLRNPPNDARAMAALLRQLGFAVTEKTDLDLRGFRQQVNAFLDQSRGAELRLFYYSGHGASYDGDNYLLPIGHGITRQHELPDQAYSLRTLLRGLKGTSGGVNLVLLDSCRDAPFGDAKSIWEDSKGMKPMQPQEGVLIGYAAQNGRTASDNSGGSNSLYTKYLLQELGQTLELREALMRVRQAVYDESRGEQRPTTEDEVLGKVYLAAADAPREPPSVTTGTLVIRNSQPPGAVLYVDGKRLGSAPQTVSLKAGQHTIEAKQAGYADYRDTVQVRAGEQTVLNVVLTAVQRESVPVAPAPTAPAARPAFEPEMVAITGGCFQMGSPNSEPDRNDNERQHEVCVKAFEIGVYEVTQQQWHAVIGSNPSYYFYKNCADCPVGFVSWKDIQDYLRKLNQRTGKQYRLPTEAEWEYACRGGQVGERYCGGNDVDRLGWYDGNSGGKPQPTGQKNANGFGLYDMSGNVWEWTCSEYKEDYDGAEQKCNKRDLQVLLTLRGGSWSDGSASMRSAGRLGLAPAGCFNGLGFRLARSL